MNNLLVMTDDGTEYHLEYMPHFEPPTIWVRKYRHGWKVHGGTPLPRNWGYIII